MARPGRSPRPARPIGLDEELVRPLGGALVGQVERDVGRDDPDERHRRDVEALGDEARPDEDVEPTVGEGVDDPLRRAPALDDVAVEAADAQAREAVADLALDALRAAAEVADPRRAAGRAAGRERRRPAAVVAAQRRPGLVVDERPLAVRAGLDVTAVAAQDDRRRPAPVEDEDRLLAGAGVERGERRRERPRQQAALARGQLRAQVDDLDRRAAARPGAPGRTTRRYRPARARPDAVDRRRRRPEDDRRPGQARPARIATSRAWSRGVRSLL